MELTVQNVYGLLLRSKLMAVDEARAMMDRWRQEAGEAAGDVAQFARWMVANKYTTEYQASLLARGHADGFFLNEYRILDRLGKGRMAGVYKAVHDQSGQVVAIKVLPPSRAKTPALLARFQREARLSLKLRHPNVVRTFQVGTAQPPSGEPLHYLVMEFLNGEPLDEVLQRRKQLPPGEAVRLIYQALQGLQHLHEQGMIHRDLKPANLFLTYPPGPQPADTLHATVKIVDLGLSRALADEVEREAGPTDLTAVGVVLGTPDYMAPEQAQNARAADIRSDIYSLGCVLYHLLAGHPPFPDTNIISQMIRHATEQPRPLCESNPAVPDGLQQIVSWMIEKDPARRYPTPERAAGALKAFLLVGQETAAEPDQKLQQYESWLELEAVKGPPAPEHQPREKRSEREKNRKPAAKRPLKPAPAEKSEAPPPLELPPLELPPPEPAGRPGPKGKKKRRPLAPVAPPIDVELVALPPTTLAGEQKLFSLPLTRRDLVMFALGVGTVLLAIAIGALGVLLISSLS